MNVFLLRIVFLAVFSLAAFNSTAQVSELGSWTSLFINGKLSKSLSIQSDIQYRCYDAGSDLEQLLARAGIGYDLTENNHTVLVGYAYAYSQNYSSADIRSYLNEHRIYQQFAIRSKAGRVNFQHRYRFEQRFFEHDFRMRFRYYLGLTIPLNKAVMENKTIYFAAYNEVFLNNQKTVFDRDRLYGGFGYRLNDHFRLELGYMNQFLDGRQRDQVMVVLNVAF
jgi:hypothetical protein